VSRDELRSAPWANHAAPKIAEIVRLCRLHADERIIVFSQFNAPLRVIAAAHVRAGFAAPPVISGNSSTQQREALQRVATTDMAPPILLCTTGSMYQSATLTAYSVVIFSAPNSSHEVTNQSIARAWRYGQQRRVKV